MRITWVYSFGESYSPKSLNLSTIVNILQLQITTVKYFTANYLSNTFVPIPNPYNSPKIRFHLLHCRSQNLLSKNCKKKCKTFIIVLTILFFCNKNKPYIILWQVNTNNISLIIATFFFTKICEKITRAFLLVVYIVDKKCVFYRKIGNNEIDMKFISDIGLEVQIVWTTKNRQEKQQFVSFVG